MARQVERVGSAQSSAALAMQAELALLSVA
jgi:hypothetical protein